MSDSDKAPCVTCVGTGIVGKRFLGNPYWDIRKYSWVEDYEKIYCDYCNGTGMR